VFDWTEASDKRKSKTEIELRASVCVDNGRNRNFVCIALTTGTQPGVSAERLGFPR